MWATFAGGALLVVATFLPWYAVNISPPFEPGSLRGWDATNFARVALVLGVVAAAAALIQLLGARGTVAVDARVAAALAWIGGAAAIVAAGLVAFRLLAMPDPAELLSRQAGLYLACAAAVVAAVGALSSLATHR